MRINSPARQRVITPNTENLAGGDAYTVSDAVGLYLQVCSSFFGEDRYYETGAQSLARFFDLTNKVSPIFLLKLASYARNAMHLRSVSTALLVEAARRGVETGTNERNMVRQYVPKIIKRADELANALAYYQVRYGVDVRGERKVRNLPLALKKGLADSFHTFNEYQFAKYAGSRNEMKLRDVIRIVHPKPMNDAEAALFGKIAADELAPADTWEVLISTRGSNTDTWNEAAGLMGPMAMMRNLRNFEQHNATRAIELAVEKLSNRDVIASSRILPFRWFTAMKQVTNPHLREACRTALDLAAESIPDFTASTMIAIDRSGSMGAQLSAKSIVTLEEAGAVMSAIAVKKAPVSVPIIFADTHQVIDASRRDSVMTTVQSILRPRIGYSTHAHLAVQHLTRNRIAVDRIVIVSDMQCYGHAGGLNDAVREYRNRVNPKVHVYSIDLVGHGTSQFSEKDQRVTLLSGFSERVFDFFDHVEKENPVQTIMETW